MRLNRLLLIAGLIVFFLASPPASAEGPLNDLGRFLGWGWSNGRHANNYSGWAGHHSVYSQPVYSSGWQSVPQPTSFPAEEWQPQPVAPSYQTRPANTASVYGGIPVYRHTAENGRLYPQGMPYYWTVPARR